MSEYKDYGIEYASKNLLFISDFESIEEKWYFILLSEKESKIKEINTFTDGLTNNDVINIIKELLNNNYDIDYEIELYKKSFCYDVLKCNDEE